MDQIRDAGAEMFALSVDTPQISTSLREELDLNFTLLCDVEKRVVRDWDRFSRFEVGGIAIPTTFVIGTDMTVRYRSIEKMSRRHTPEMLLNFLRSGVEVEPDHELDGEEIKPSASTSMASPFRIIRNLFRKKFA